MTDEAQRLFTMLLDAAQALRQYSVLAKGKVDFSLSTFDHAMTLMTIDIGSAPGILI